MDDRPASSRTGAAVPTFYASEKLTVTGATIVVHGTTYPLSSVVSVSSGGWWSAAGAFLAALGMSVTTGFFGLIFPSPWMWLMAGGSAVMAVLIALTAVLTRSVVIELQSGEALEVGTWEPKEAVEMCEALERALEYRGSVGARGASVASELERLAALRSSGALSEDDWARAKDLFLGKAPDAQERAVEHLRELHDLWRSGVLSESEFNAKKWEVLSRR